MENIKNQSAGRLDFAFKKFLDCRYPVLVDMRTYLSAQYNKFHNHDYPQAWYCMNGHYLHRIGDITYECEPGSVVVIPPGTYHTFNIPEGGFTKLIQINLSLNAFDGYPVDLYTNTIANLFMPAFSKKLGYHFPTYYQLCRDSCAIFEECASWLISLPLNHSEIERKHIFSKLERIFSLPEFALPESFGKQVSALYMRCVQPPIRAISFLNQHYQDKIVEADISRIAAVCRSDLCMYFKQFTGYTCFEYLLWLRLNYAMFYMAYTTYSLSYIADICGFSNPPHMSFVFKKYYGVTPSE